MCYVITYLNITKKKGYCYIIIILNIGQKFKNFQDFNKEVCTPLFNK